MVVFSEDEETDKNREVVFYIEISTDMGKFRTGELRAGIPDFMHNVSIREIQETFNGVLAYILNASLDSRDAISLNSILLSQVEKVGERYMESEGIA